MSFRKLTRDLYKRDVLELAPDLLGRELVHRSPDGVVRGYTIMETEAYRGEDDLACHASRGRTKRTEIMYQHGGMVYMYLIYGMYWMFNIVSGPKEVPQAVLLRGIEGWDGPGKLTRELELDRSYYGEDLVVSDRIWVSERKGRGKIQTGPRINIDYAGTLWKNKPWRYIWVPE